MLDRDKMSKPTQKQTTGKKGEELALQFLIEKGFSTLATNYRAGKGSGNNGEIDIVVKKENVIHFIEVKTRKNNDFGNPEAFVSEAQASKISQTAELFLEKYEEESNQKFKGFIQFDIISILFEKDNLKEILHLEDAF
ncbi:MAG: YraN family protein [Flexibacter sp. CG_4_10_14_3_um_filter_32_15]|nr:MAG: YraN family protein [Flexibacter sp. CG_4_10_14_3_um_filter_32_15]